MWTDDWVWRARMKMDEAPKDGQVEGAGKKESQKEKQVMVMHRETEEITLVRGVTRNTQRTANLREDTGLINRRSGDNKMQSLADGVGLEAGTRGLSLAGFSREMRNVWWLFMV
ncbi:unnamed protein product [Pleuronectes platessa]|uniref:Uncharacterized protein n=1 Tax=Pleuronectes platessa TaxID=8262 RepID=A0A9N7U308_PLEPL|nr:unnamed protein product [Pleuronectes platessa]